jgi:acetylornithine deacetylase/succinyl-diaminopimelate desuccinylase-like protein
VPKGVEISFTGERGGTPAPTLPEDHPLLVATSRALERIYGRKPIPVRSGGTLPVSAIFEEMLGIGTLTCGLAMPDENIHAPNEFFRLSSLDEGLRSWPALFTELGKLSAADFAPFRR